MNNIQTSGNGVLGGAYGKATSATSAATATATSRENLSSKVTGLTPEEVVTSPNFLLIDGVLVGAVTITPAMAEEWLKRNVANIRNSKEPSIGEYAEAMRKGQWDFNGAPICYDKDGNLIDGQNRLMACVLANTPFTTSVAYGVVSAVNIDMGRKRTLAELLASLGFTSQAQVSAVVNGIHNYRAKGGTSFNQVGHGEKVLTKKDALAFAEENRDRLTHSVSSTKKTKAVFGKQGYHATMHFLFSEIAGTAIADEFYDKLTSGIGLTSTSPILHLRNRLISHAVNKNEKMTDSAYAGIIIKCWNAWISGQEMIRLTYSYEREKIAKIRRSPVK